MAVNIDCSAWQVPSIFKWLAKTGDVKATEMLKTFNCGIGMILVTAPQHADEITTILENAGETFYKVGFVSKRENDAVLYSNLQDNW
jgi:phosphoribosylformylglycinamidine cyclo-ligase